MRALSHDSLEVWDKRKAGKSEAGVTADRDSGSCGISACN